MDPETIVTIIAALLGPTPDASNFPAVANGGVDSRYPVEVSSCIRPVAPGEIEGETVICGTVNVPENHAAPDGTRLDLSFVVYRSRSASPAPDAIAHLHGGPGGGIVSTIALTTFVFDALRERRDIVAFDQRGVDASGLDMDCFETLAENVEPVVRQIAGEEFPDLELDLIQSCITELGDRGFDLQYINTEQNAFDVQAVMSTLGYPVYNIYGISYGTKLGLEVMRTAPEGLRSVVLDSVAPTHIPTYNTLLTPHVEAIENTFAACESDPVCDEAYPDITARYWAVVDAMNETPIELSSGEMDGTDLFEFVGSRNAWNDPTNRGMSTYLPLMVHELEQGILDTLEALTSGILPPQQSPESILANAPELSPNELALALAAFDAVTHIETALETANRSIIQLETDLAEDRDDSDLVSYLDREMTSAMNALADTPRTVSFARDYLNLRFAEPSSAALRNLVALHFDNETAARLSVIINLLSETEVAETFELIGTDNEPLEQVFEGGFETYLFACQEDFVDGFNSVEGFDAENERLEFATSLIDDEDEVQSMFRACEVFDEHPRPGAHDPVTSDIPTLVLSGELDTQTAASWGPEVARHLPNGNAIVFPESGHGTLLFSDCAQDIGVAFIENPESEINTTCVETMRLPFVLPDGTLTTP